MNTLAYKSLFKENDNKHLKRKGFKDVPLECYASPASTQANFSHAFGTSYHRKEVEYFTADDRSS